MNSATSWGVSVICAIILAAVFVEVDGARQASNYRNVEVLTGMTDREILSTMQSWSRDLGVTCVVCHVQGDFAAEDMTQKQVAREMSQMVSILNELPYFSDSDRKADCFLCHKGALGIDREAGR